MKKSKELRVSTYIAGFFVIATSLLLTVFLILTMIGLVHPRQQKLVVHTPNISKSYDGVPLAGSEPAITFGQLHYGHRLEVTSIPQYSEVGEYENRPTVRIMDDTGADVTKQYSIDEDYGTLTIYPRGISVTCTGKVKVYDGQPLTADLIRLHGGDLVSGHELVVEEGTSILFPGTEPIDGAYRIVSETGVDVTDQYSVKEYLGDLTILPINLTLETESAHKIYDGEKLTAQKWNQVDGALLQGHSIAMDMTTSLSVVGSIPNEGTARVLDENGKDVTNIYNIQYRFGTLEVQGIPLYVRTESAGKIYDGTALSNPDWELTGGTLEPGATIQIQEKTNISTVGTVDNIINFKVLGADGKDITSRYSFECDYGTLTIQPRALTIRTGSAQKVYDGMPLSCDAFEIIRGSLCENEQIELVGTSITNVGYSENYVLDCTVYRVEADGTRTDVSACYRISFDYGLLRITMN